MDLSGTWRFHFSARPDLAPHGAEAVDFDDVGWDSIDLPGHWVLQGRDDWSRPAYTNVAYPFPVDVPNVPDENPTGGHRLAFDVSEDFIPDGGRVLLRFGGVESLCIASLNGVEVGVVRGSRLAQEIDVTAELRPGPNVLHLRVHQRSAHSYLEDQDQWWLPGVFREVDLAVTLASPEEVTAIKAGPLIRGAQIAQLSMTWRSPTPSRPALCGWGSVVSRSSVTSGW